MKFAQNSSSNKLVKIINWFQCLDIFQIGLRQVNNEIKAIKTFTSEKGLPNDLKFNWRGSWRV